MEKVSFSGIKAVLFDIEGTVSDIAFVKNVLFPYSAAELPGFVSENFNGDDVQSAKALAEETLGQSLDADGVVAALLKWIDEDVKHPALKALQGKVWKKGFEEGEFQAPLYSDVLPAMKAWKEQGRVLAIYSSGSIGAQKLFFGHTDQGDILNLLSGFYDLTTGGKRESSSYVKISSTMSIDASAILFFSDVEEELDAAKEAGFATCQALRPGIEAGARHQQVSSFEFIELV